MVEFAIGAKELRYVLFSELFEPDRITSGESRQLLGNKGGVLGLLERLKTSKTQGVKRESVDARQEV